MNRAAILALVLVVAFLGMADSWYLAQTALSGVPLACDFGAALDGCNAVAQSRYSHLFGIPLGIYGLGFYGAVFLLAALLGVCHRRPLYRALASVTALGLLASIVFVLIQVFLIHALCVYCLASAGFSFILFALGWQLSLAAPPKPLAVKEV